MRARSWLSVGSTASSYGSPSVCSLFSGFTSVTGNRTLTSARCIAALAKFHTGFQPLVPLATVLLAEIEGDMGEPNAAIAMLDDLLNEIERTGQRWFDAEVHRQRGELILRRDCNDVRGAEAAFERALAVARSQNARTFELRAATQLARLWRYQGKDTAARDILMPICSAFANGRTTPDLQEATTLLGTLT